MREFDELSKEITDTVRAAMESIPKDIGQQVREAVEDLTDEDLGPGDQADVVEHTFEVGRLAELSVGTVSGRIAIQGADVSTITVRATKRGSRRRMESTTIDMSQSGNRVSVKTRSYGGGRWGLRGNVCSVDYEITVPHTCRVEAEGVSADITLDHTRGDTELKTVSGDINVHDGAGNYGVTTVSGDLVIANLDGELRLRTTSGDATVRDSRLHGFNLNTVSGDLMVETPLATGEHYFAKTVSGDLAIAVPPGTGAIVQMKSVSGDVSSDLPAEIIKSTRRNWQGRINGGGANVEMHSVSGDLRIMLGSGRAEGFGPLPARPEPTPPHYGQQPGFIPRAERPVPPVPPVPPVAPQAPAEPGGETSPAAGSDSDSATAEILRRLAQGEISVEDAMTQLDALGG